MPSMPMRGIVGFSFRDASRALGHDRMKAMNIKEEHHRFITLLKKEGRDPGGFPIASYLGTMHMVYNVPVPILQRLAKDWAKTHRSVSQDNLVLLIDALFRGKSREEKKTASLILGTFSQYLRVLKSSYLDQWIGELTGWEEADSFCDEIDVWLRADVANRLSLLKKWNKDKQIEKRRASLVVLCSSVRNDDSKTLRDFSFVFIDALKEEKHIMITKAISWLLRSLIKYHKTEVARYLRENASSLPPIAVREVTKKLETGRK